MRIIFDIETDGLLDDVSKIHCMSWYDIDNHLGMIETTTSLQVMQDVMDRASTLIGHNIVCYDIPVLERMGVKVGTHATLIDTLALSWNLMPNRKSHGLGAWGITIGNDKISIDDWQNLSEDDYKLRCEVDVEINLEVYKLLTAKADRLYNGSTPDKLYKYLAFKMSCIRDQEASGMHLNLDAATSLLSEMSSKYQEAYVTLASVMPWVAKYKTAKKPQTLAKKDGHLSIAGERWINLLKDNGYPLERDEDITVFDCMMEPNPGSPQQIKDWLFSLGWKPETFKWVADKNGGTRAIPQVKSDDDLCPSIYKLDIKELDYLKETSVLSHRIAVVKGLIDAVDDDGKVQARMHGITNTMRFRHVKPVVNLPGVDAPYGLDIRSLLIGEFAGCDMVSLEDTTKRHYMLPIDPKYVEEMEQPGFDPHLDLAVRAGAITEEDIQKRPEYTKMTRKVYKMVNYSAVYGVGAKTLSRQADISVQRAAKIISSYWERNWAVTHVERNAKVRKILDELWIFNPVSEMWYNLRYDKDKWSTLNQSTGVFVFDKFVNYCKKGGLNIVMQMHDEVLVDCKGNAGKVKDVLEEAIKQTNEDLGMNVPFHIDYKFGSTYAAVH